METYYWTTETFHANNNVTMDDYLDNHLDENSEVLVVDGTYAEIESNGVKYEVHASGDGNSFNHKVEFIELALVKNKIDTLNGN